MSRKAASSFVAAVGALAQRGDEVDCRLHARECLVAHRAGLEAMAGGQLARRAHAVGRPAREQLLAREAEALVRAEELVRRAQQHVGAQRAHVDAAVRRVVHAVHPGQRADGVRDVGQRASGGHRADGVRGERERAHLGARADDLLERRGLDLQIAVAHVCSAHDEAVILGAQQPRAHVGVVVERRDDDLVTRLQRAAEGVHEVEVDRRHVGAEDDLLGLRAEEVGRRDAGRVDELRRLRARHERAVDVRVRVPEVVRHGVDHDIRHLRATRAVEEDERPAVGSRAGERREGAADGVDVGQRDSCIGGSVVQQRRIDWRT